MTSLRLSHRPTAKPRSKKTFSFNVDGWKDKVVALSPWTDLEKVKTDNEYPSTKLTPTEAVYSTEKEIAHLVQQMHSVFIKVDGVAKASGGCLTVEESMAFADSYRALIRQGLADLTQRTNYPAHAADALVVGDIIWGLVENILIRPHDRSVVADLIEWAQSTFLQSGKYFNEIQTLATQTLRVETEPIFWNAVLAQISVGNTKSAAAILQMSTNYRSNSNLQRMVSLLSAFNVSALHKCDESADNFIAAQQQVHNNLHHFADDEPLSLICRIVLGDFDGFKTLAECLKCPWYQLMPAYVLFTDARSNMKEIHLHAQKVYNEISVADSDLSIDVLNEVIGLLIRCEWIQAMKAVSSVPSLLWLSVHLFDMIVKTDESVINEDVEAIHDEIFGAYSRLLFRNCEQFSSIEAAVTYGEAAFRLERKEFVDPWCIIAGNYYLERGNVGYGELTFNLAQSHSLIDATIKISRGIAHYFLLKRNWSCAITWAIRNENIEFINSVCYFILSAAPPTELTNLQVFKNQLPTIESEALLFLHNFHLFHEALDPLDVAKCIQLLHSLIVTQLAPSEFMHVLFDKLAQVIDATNKVLESKPLLNVQAVESLQHCVALYQAQEEVRNEISDINDKTMERYNPRTTHLHAVLSTALAHALLWCRAPKHH